MEKQHFLAPAYRYPDILYITIVIYIIFTITSKNIFSTAPAIRNAQRRLLFFRIKKINPKQSLI